MDFPHDRSNRRGAFRIDAREHVEVETPGGAARRRDGSIKNLRKSSASRKLARNCVMILGITGGIGCGKSTAAEAFERRGFRRVDSDALVRDRVLTDPAVRTALRDRFGEAVLDRDGSINRSKLGARVFAHAAELRWLEALTHPRVFALWREMFAAEPEADWAVEVPLLFEKQLENWFDFTICVASAPAQQLARLEQRGLSRALAEQRISKQLPLAHKIELADFVLWNDGAPAFLEDQIDHLIDSLRVQR
jgi:dephospho-CoA kinase